MTFRYGSVCSGIEAATAAWHHMGWEAAFFSEIEKFPCAVLEHHYPDVPLHGDFTTIKENEYGKIDLLVGGTPCQSFSVAGLRGGLDDDRGNLALEFCRLAQREQPRWIVWENVPGVLSSNGGRDFGSILGALENIGYGLAYRVLDAQYFGVAQRRRRVFVVGYLGDWRPAAAVLFERHSMSGHPAPSRQARKEAATEAATGTGGSGGNGGARSDLAGPLTAGMHKGPRGTEAVESGHVLAFSAKDYGNDVSDNISPTLRSGGAYGANGGVMPAVAYAIQDTPDVVGTLRAHHPGTAGTHSDTDHIVATYPINSMNAFRSPDAAPSTGLGVGHDGEAMYTLTKGDHHAIAFSSNMSVPDCQTDGTTPTLKLGGHGGGNPPAVAYSIMPMNSGKDYKARETDISQPLMAGGPVGGNQGGDFIVTPFDTTQLTSPYNYSNPQGGDPCHPLAAGAHPPAVTFAIQDVRGLDKKQNGKGWSDEGVSYTVDTHATQGVAQADERAVAFQPTADCLTAAYGTKWNGNASATNGSLFAQQQSAVRRLTPVECERLQGFPDNFTAIPWRKKGAEDCPDGPRYKALGNSMAVPVMRWIGERIRLVDDFVSVF